MAEFTDKKKKKKKTSKICNFLHVKQIQQALIQGIIIIIPLTMKNIKIFKTDNKTINMQK